MEIKKLSPSERVALRHLCWPQQGTDLAAIDPALPKLKEKGLVFRSSTGEWKPTAHGRFWYACVAIGLDKPL
jgi:hypothetical protein